MSSRQLLLAASASVAVALSLPVSAGAAVTARYTYTPSSPVVDTATTFDGSPSVCDRKPCTYTWRDDGPDGPGGANTLLGTGPMLYYSFGAGGDKFVRLTVTNGKGRSSTTVKTVHVSASAPPTDGDGDGISDSQDACPALPGLAPDGCPAPTPTFSYSPSSPAVGQQVSFDASATACNSTPCAYRWSHGTTDFATGLTAAFTYPTSGSKTVTLQVTDAQNRSASLSRSFTVGAPVNIPTLQQVDGGPSYYGLFSNPLPTAPDWFPISVWGSYDHTQANRDLDAAAGINTYVWVADPCNQIPAIRADGRFRVLYEESENRSCSGSETNGWMLGDEVDMCCGPPGFVGGNGYDMLTSRNSSLPVDGKLRYTNYGKGVLWWESDADAARFVNLPFLGLVSADAYWMTDPNERGNPKYGLPASYGWNVDRLRQLDGSDGRPKPIWMLVETGWPFTESAAAGGRAIQPAELRAAAWHSLIAGARGIVWFEHSFGGPHAGDHHTIRTNSEGTRAMVTSVDAQIKSLAPVLNSPTVNSGSSIGAGIRAMVKWDGHNFYVFAGSTGSAVTGQVDIPCVGDATATVVGESRTVPVTAGTLRDGFADKNAVHIYRIDGGSTCGLPAG